MFIYHWCGAGKEYIILADSVEDFTDDAGADTEQQAIKDNTDAGVEFRRRYDTDIDTDFTELPLLRPLQARH